MRIALVVNPRSGRGTGQKLCTELGDRLRQRGHEVIVVQAGGVPAGAGPSAGGLSQTAQGVDRLVVIGGDGTVHYLLPELTKLRTPMYHLGTGTANLIAHEFGMSKDPKRVVEHLEHEIEPSIAALPTCNGVPFLLMVSVGIDASVVHRLEETRAKKRGYRAYFRPVLREVLNPRIVPIGVGDGACEAADLRLQTIVVSNCKSYGGGFDPNPQANAFEQTLHAASIPMKSSLGAFVQFLLLKLRFSARSIMRQEGNSFTIRSQSRPAYVQIDGEQAIGVPGLDEGRLLPDAPLVIESNGATLVLHAPPIAKKTKESANTPKAR